jgi:hypothetical protein
LQQVLDIYLAALRRLEIIFALASGSAKALENTVDISNIDFMRILNSQMNELKLRLLDRIVEAKHETHSTGTLLRQRIEPTDMTVCKAVEDRICARMDLASRTDLSDQHVMGALRLLLKIARQNGLAVDFSAGEIFLLTHGVQQRSCSETIPGRNFAPSRY